MTGQMIKALELDKIFALFTSEGELMALARNTGLKRESGDIPTLEAEYRRISGLITAFQGTKALRLKLAEILAHPPVIRIPQPGDLLPQHELYELKCFLHYYLQLTELLASASLGEPYGFPELKALYRLLDPDGQKLPTFQLHSPVYGALAELRATQQTLTLKLKHHRQERLQQAREALDNPGLKQIFVVSPSQKELIGKLEASGYFLRTGESPSGVNFRLSDGEEGLALSARIAGLTSEIKAEEETILHRLSEKVTAEASTIRQAFEATLRLAWDYLRADFALRYDCCIPELTHEPVFILKAMTNLPVMLRLKEKDRSYQRLDISFDSTPVNLITGANMGGKTTLLKGIGQIAQLVRLAIPVPARQARVAVVDAVWTNHNKDTGTEDLSSFGKEVVSLVKALKAPGRSLFLLDEFAKGTNPAEGEAICSAVLEHLTATEHLCLAATHFSAPTKLRPATQYMTAGFDPAFLDSLSRDSELELRLRRLSEAMDYSLIRLGENQDPPHAAISIAKALGLPPEILTKIPEHLL